MTGALVLGWALVIVGFVSILLGLYVAVMKLIFQAIHRYQTTGATESIPVSEALKLLNKILDLPGGIFFVVGMICGGVGGRLLHWW